jgi:hypothetical protein
VKSVHAIWKDGRIVPTQPVDWPDGTALRIQPIEKPHPDPTEDDLWGDDPGAVARRVAFYEALPPLKMTASEEAEWQAARWEMKEYTNARMQARFTEGGP